MPTVAEAAAACLADCEARRLARGTLVGYRKYLGVLTAAFGPRRLDTLAAREVEADSRRPTWSEDYRRNYLAAVEMVCRHAGRPLVLDKPPRGSAGADVVISEETYRLALADATGDLRPLLVVLWNTGCRPAEGYGLTVEGVDWEGGTATLREHKTARKTRRSRLLVFPSPAMEALRGQRERYGSGLLFRTLNGAAFSDKGLSRRMWDLSERIGRRVRAYSLRHSWASRALAGGTPDAHVAAVMGHTSTAMVAKHYGHLDSNARLLKATVERVSGEGRAAG